MLGCHNATRFHTTKDYKPKAYRRIMHRCLSCSKEGGLLSMKLGEYCSSSAPCSREALEHIRHDMQEY
jgi:hypothetical protein